MSAHKQQATLALVVGASTLIGLATLFPAAGGGSPGLWCLACGELGGQDLILNVLLFVPLGLALALHKTRPRPALLSLVALTLVIESLQWKVIPGRDASLGDVLANSFGGGLAFAASAWIRTARSRPYGLRRLAMCLSAMWLGCLCVAAWGLLPAPQEYPAWVQLAPVRRGFSTFDGTVMLEAYGRSWPNGMPISPAQFPALARGYADFKVEATRRRAQSPGSNVLIMRLANGSQVIAQVSLHDRDLAYRGFFNASRLRLRSPLFRLRGGFPEGESRVTLQVQSRPGAVSLRADGPVSGVVATEERVTVARGWEMLSPVSVIPATLDRMSRHLWLAAGFFVVALALAVSFPTGVAGAIALGLVGLGLGAVPVSLGLQACAPLEFAGGLAGVCLGLFVGAGPLRSRLTG